MNRIVWTLAFMLGIGLTSAASAQFTVPTATTTSTELAAISSALSPTSLTSAIDKFDAAAPMGHPRLLKGQSDFAGIVAATKAERLGSVTSISGYLKRNCSHARQCSSCHPTPNKCQ